MMERAAKIKFLTDLQSGKALIEDIGGNMFEVWLDNGNSTFTMDKLTLTKEQLLKRRGEALFVHID